MLVSARQSIACCYRVEVSGWDFNESFFVEKSELAWGKLTEKQIALNHMLPEGAVVFVGLLQSSANERVYPVAYEAELIAPDSDGRYQFRLTQVHPRPTDCAMTMH